MKHYLNKHYPPRKEGVTLVVRQNAWSADPVHIIQQGKNDERIVNLHLQGITFTEKNVQALTELLQFRFFSFVLIHQCDTGFLEKNHYGWFGLAKALADQVNDLLIDETGDLLTIVLEQKRLQFQNLTIRLRKHGLTVEQCLMLGKRIANSPELKRLSLKETDIHAPALLAPGIATCYHLETLILADTSSMPAASPRVQQQALADLLLVSNTNSRNKNAANPRYPPKPKYGIGAVLRLLLSPASCLKVLDLSNLHLQDEHAATLAKALTINNTLEQLNLSFNDIGLAGVLEVAHHLPRMQKLRKLALKPNPWGDNDRDEGGQALLEGMKHNVSIEYLDSLLMIPQAPMLRYYTILNRGGRRIVMNGNSSNGNKPVPRALWPIILERASKIFYGVAEEKKAKLDALYYFLRNNGPVLIFQR